MSNSDKINLVSSAPAGPPFRAETMTVPSLDHAALLWWSLRARPSPCTVDLTVEPRTRIRQVQQATSFSLARHTTQSVDACTYSNITTRRVLIRVRTAMILEQDAECQYAHVQQSWLVRSFRGARNSQRESYLFGTLWACRTQDAHGSQLGAMGELCVVFRREVSHELRRWLPLSRVARVETSRRQ